MQFKDDHALPGLIKAKAVADVLRASTKRIAQHSQRKPVQDEVDSTLDLPTRIGRRRCALTVPELAEALNLSRRQVYNFAKHHRLPSYRIAGSVRFDPVMVAKWLRDQAA